MEVKIAILHLQSVQRDYDARVKEIEGYFTFVGLLDLGQRDVVAAMQGAGIDETALFKTLKANCFLLLYNLMEAVTKNAIQGIYDHLRVERVEYDDCCDGLKKTILTNVKGLSVDEAHTRLGILVQHIVSETFSVQNLLSGNVHKGTLRDLANKYGFSPKLASRHSDGERLVDVKEKRNALAHGNLTFDEVGKDATFPDLVIIKNNVLFYMQQFIINIDIYLQKKKYLL